MNNLYIIYFIILICDLILGLIRFKYLSKNARLILWLVSLTIISEGFTTLNNFSGINILYVYHIFMPIEMILVGFSFWLIKRSNTVLLMTIFSVLFMIVNSIFIQNYSTDFGSYGFVLMCIILSVFALNYFYYLLISNREVIVFRNSQFWISLGFLFFSIVNLFLLGTFNFISEMYPEINKIFTNLRFFSNYILYVCIGISFLSNVENVK